MPAPSPVQRSSAPSPPVRSPCPARAEVARHLADLRAVVLDKEGKSYLAVFSTVERAQALRNMAGYCVLVDALYHPARARQGPGRRRQPRHRCRHGNFSRGRAAHREALRRASRTTTSQLVEHRQARTARYCPVDPKPPALRTVASRSSVSTKVASSLCTTRNCATRLPLGRLTGSPVVFSSTTFSSPR